MKQNTKSNGKRFFSQRDTICLNLKISKSLKEITKHDDQPKRRKYLKLKKAKSIKFFIET